MISDERKGAEPCDVLAEAGGPVDEVRVTLGVHGPDVDPAEISALLGREPTSAHRRGDSRGGAMAPWPQGAWLLRVEAKAPRTPEDVVQQMRALLPGNESIWAQLRARHTVRITFGLFSGAWNRGFELSPASVAFLAGTGAHVGFDLYADDGQ